MPQPVYIAVCSLGTSEVVMVAGHEAASWRRAREKERLFPQHATSTAAAKIQNTPLGRAHKNYCCLGTVVLSVVVCECMCPRAWTQWMEKWETRHTHVRIYCTPSHVRRWASVASPRLLQALCDPRIGSYFSVLVRQALFHMHDSRGVGCGKPTVGCFAWSRHPGQAHQQRRATATLAACCARLG